MNNIKQLLNNMSDIEQQPINESKFLGHRHKHEFTKETVDPKVEPEDDEKSDLDKIKESLIKAYEDFVTPKSSIIDKSLQKKLEKADDKDDFSFTAKVKDKKEPVKVECKNAFTFESKLLRAIKHPRFAGLVDYSFPVSNLNEGLSSQSIIPCALKLAPLLKPETREDAFSAMDNLRDSGMSVDDIKQVWRLAKIFRNSKKPDIDPVDEATIQPIAPVAPIDAATTAQTAQTNQPAQNNQQNTTQNTNQQQNQQQTDQQKPATPPPATTTAKDAITTMLDTIKKNPSAIDTLKKGISNLPQ